jgi:hypothetical protein
MTTGRSISNTPVNSYIRLIAYFGVTVTAAILSGCGSCAPQQQTAYQTEDGLASPPTESADRQLGAPTIRSADLSLTLDCTAPAPEQEQTIYDQANDVYAVVPAAPRVLPRLATGVDLLRSDGSKIHFSDSSSKPPESSTTDQDSYRLTVSYAPQGASDLLGHPLADGYGFAALSTKLPFVLGAEGFQCDRIAEIVLRFNGVEVARASNLPFGPRQSIIDLPTDFGTPRHGPTG